jgi:hypothetical protein
MTTSQLIQHAALSRQVGVSADQKQIGKHTAPFNLGARSCHGLDSHKIWAAARPLPRQKG